MGIPGTGEHGAVVGGPVDESLGQDARSRHFPSFALPKKKDRLLPVPAVWLEFLNLVWGAGPPAVYSSSFHRERKTVLFTTVECQRTSRLPSPL